MMRVGCWTCSPRWKTTLLTWSPSCAFRGTRNNRACLTSCSTKPTGIFFFLGGHPSCLLPVRGVGGAGRAGRQMPHTDISKRVEVGQACPPRVCISICASGPLTVGCSAYIKRYILKCMPALEGFAFRWKF